MNVAVKLGAFTLALGVAFAGTYAVGAFVGPVGVTDAGSHDMADGAAAAHDGTAGHGAEAEASGPGGLAVSADGYTLRQLSAAPAAGQAGEFAFQILDAAGVPVTEFRTSHDKQLHLILARRDLTGFQHLHPAMSPDGTWRTPLSLPAAGDWRVFADFVPQRRDAQVVLGLDVAAARATAIVDRYTVTIEGSLIAGRLSRLTLTVTRDGVPVTDLQPYLGAYGHLVALRAGDLGYLHVHPQATATPGPAIVFDVEVPTAGAYRLFLDFQHNQAVHTAAFTATAS